MYSRIFAIIASVAVVLGVAIAPTVLGTADAKITEEVTRTCTNGGGHEKDCDTPPANEETRTCEASNPAGKNPGGHNPC